MYQDGVINGAEVEGTDSEGGEEDALLTRGNVSGGDRELSGFWDV